MTFDSLNYLLPPELRGHPLLMLPKEDLDLIVELVLKSGSLKDLSSSYGVSYPTIRARLDKVIERLGAVVQGRKPDPVSDLLATLVERGEMTPGAARAVKSAVRRQADAAAPAAPMGDSSGEVKQR